MNEELQNLIKTEVEKQIKKEKLALAKLIEQNFLYTGEFAGARKLIDTIDRWAMQ